MDVCVFDWGGGTTAAAPPPFRFGNPALCGSHPVVTPYCKLGIFCIFWYIVSPKNPPCSFVRFFLKRLGIFNQSHTYYMFLSTLDYKFLFNYLQLWRSYAILSETAHWIFAFHYNFNFWVCLLNKWRHCSRHIISNMFVDIIKTADLWWIATYNDQQSYQRLSRTYECERFGRCWTFWAYYLNYIVALNMLKLKLD